jgi:DNA polymerase III subunit delta
MPKKRKVLEVLKTGLSEATEVVLLSGSDEYLHDLLIKKFEADIVDPDFRDFNFRKLDCNKSSSAGEIAGLLSELPTLVDSRMVVLNRVKDLSKNVSKRLAEIWRDSLAPGTVLVVTAGGAVSDLPFWVALQKSGTVVDCRLEEKEIDLLLNSFCRQKKYKADSRALSVLKERVGLSLRGLLSNLERCLLSLPEGESLSAATVEELVPFSAEIAMWKMTRAISQRNHKEALAILDNQLGRGEPAGPIFSYINSYLVSLVQVGGLMKRHRSPAEVARQIPRKTEFQIKKTLEDLRTWSARDLTDAFDALARADFKSKGGDGGSDPKLLLQMLILKLCSRKQGRARR